MKKEDKNIKMTTACAELCKDVSAFVIIRVDHNGKLQLNADGTAFELTFMEKALQGFVTKVMDGKI